MERERFKQTMKARGHWQDGELKAAEPVSYIREDDRGSVTLIEPAKGPFPVETQQTGRGLCRL